MLLQSDGRRKVISPQEPGEVQVHSVIFWGYFQHYTAYKYLTTTT